MVLDPGPREPAEKRRRGERELRYLQPDLSEEQRRKYLGSENQERQDARGDGGNAESSYGAAPVYAGAAAFPGPSQVQTGGGVGIGYAGAAVGFGVGVGNMGGNGMLSDDFLLDAGLENLDWLDTVDWTRGPWIDLN